MSWYIYALLAVAIGSFGAICQKWALNLKVNRTKFLVTVFSGLLILYFFYGFSELKTIVHGPDRLTFILWGLLIAALSMIGNLAGLKAYRQSPNPGYVQAVTSTNAILILISAAILFGSPINLHKIFGVFLVLIGLWPLIGKFSIKKDGAWQLPSIIAMLAYGAMLLVVKEMAILGFGSAPILTILFFFATIGFWLLYLLEKPKAQAISKIVIIPIILYIIIAFVANLANFIAIALAPNAGYVASVGNSSIILVLILSVIFFPKEEGGEFNLAKWLGALLIISGVILTII